MDWCEWINASQDVLWTIPVATFVICWEVKPMITHNTVEGVGWIEDNLTEHSWDGIQSVGATVPSLQPTERAIVRTLVFLTAKKQYANGYGQKRAKWGLHCAVIVTVSVCAVAFAYILNFYSALWLWSQSVDAINLVKWHWMQSICPCFVSR